MELCQARKFVMELYKIYNILVLLLCISLGSRMCPDLYSRVDGTGSRLKNENFGPFRIDGLHGSLPNKAIIFSMLTCQSFWVQVVFDSNSENPKHEPI